MFTSRRPRATFGCHRKSLLKPRRMRNRSSRALKPSPRRTSRAGKWHTFTGSEPIVDGMQSVRCLVIPRDIPAMNFPQRDKKSCFWATSSMHCASSAASRGHREFSTSTRLRLRRRGINCCLGSRAEDSVIRGAAYEFSALGRLRKEGSGYGWAPVVFTDQWDAK